jgi:hypothetical protein
MSDISEVNLIDKNIERAKEYAKRFLNGTLTSDMDTDEIFTNYVISNFVALTEHVMGKEIDTVTGLKKLTFNYDKNRYYWPLIRDIVSKIENIDGNIINPVIDDVEIKAGENRLISANDNIKKNIWTFHKIRDSICHGKFTPDGGSIHIDNGKYGLAASFPISTLAGFVFKLKKIKYYKYKRSEFIDKKIKPYMVENNCKELLANSNEELDIDGNSIQTYDDRDHNIVMYCNMIIDMVNESNIDDDIKRKCINTIKDIIKSSYKASNNKSYDVKIMELAQSIITVLGTKEDGFTAVYSYMQMLLSAHNEDILNGITKANTTLEEINKSSTHVTQNQDLVVPCLDLSKCSNIQIGGDNITIDALWNYLNDIYEKLKKTIDQYYSIYNKSIPLIKITEKDIEENEKQENNTDVTKQKILFNICNILKSNKTQLKLKIYNILKLLYIDTSKRILLINKEIINGTRNAVDHRGVNPSKDGLVCILDKSEKNSNKDNFYCNASVRDVYNLVCSFDEYRGILPLSSEAYILSKNDLDAIGCYLSSYVKKENGEYVNVFSKDDIDSLIKKLQDIIIQACQIINNESFDPGSVNIKK